MSSKNKLNQILKTYNPYSNENSWIQENAMENSKSIRDVLRNVLILLTRNEKPNINAEFNKRSIEKLVNSNKAELKKSKLKNLDVTKLKENTYLNSLLNASYGAEKRVKNMSSMDFAQLLKKYDEFLKSGKMEDNSATFCMDAKMIAILKNCKDIIASVADKLEKDKRIQKYIQPDPRIDIPTDVSYFNRYSVNGTNIKKSIKKEDGLGQYIQNSWSMVNKWGNIDFTQCGIGLPEDFAKFMISCLNFLTVVPKIDNSAKTMPLNTYKNYANIREHFNYFLKKILMTLLRNHESYREEDATSRKYYTDWNKTFTGFIDAYHVPIFLLSTKQFWFPMNASPYQTFENYIISGKINPPNPTTSKKEHINILLEGIKKFYTDATKKMNNGSNVSKINKVRELFNESLVVFIHHWINYSCDVLIDMTNQFNKHIENASLKLPFKDSVIASLNNLKKILHYNLYYYYDLRPTDSVDGIRGDCDNTLEARLNLEDETTQFWRVVGGGKNIGNSYRLNAKEFLLQYDIVTPGVKDKDTYSSLLDDAHIQISTASGNNKNATQKPIPIGRLTAFVQSDFVFPEGVNKYCDLYTKQPVYMGGFILDKTWSYILYMIVTEVIQENKKSLKLYSNYLKKVEEKSRKGFNQYTYYYMVKSIYDEIKSSGQYLHDKALFYDAINISLEKLVKKYKEYLDQQYGYIKQLEGLGAGEKPTNEKAVEKLYKEKKKLQLLKIHAQMKCILYRYTVMKVAKFFVNGGNEFGENGASMASPQPSYPNLILTNLNDMFKDAESKYQNMAKNARVTTKVPNKNKNKGNEASALINNKKVIISNTPAAVAANNTNKKKSKSLMNKIRNKLIW